MQANCKLILVEGLCGTGKSTLAERINCYLVQQGTSSCFYDEGANGHPASLNWHAFFREDEFKALIERYPNKSNEIKSKVIKYDNNYLIPYREAAEFKEPSTLYAELRSHELCWADAPKATRSEFTHLIQRHWARFAEHSRNSDEVYVLEAVFFQHQIHDLLGHYQADDRHIEQHIYGIAEQIVSMNPVLIYLTQPSVREQQVWISSVRAKPHFATEENIMFMENRKRIEMMLIDKIPFPAYKIENAHHDWEEVFRQTLEELGGSFDKK